MLDFNEATDDGVAVASGGPCAPRTRQITVQAPIYLYSTASTTTQWLSENNILCIGQWRWLTASAEIRSKL